MNLRLGPFIKERALANSRIKKHTLITPMDLKQYGNSEFAVKIVELLKNPQSKKIILQDAINARNHIMLMLCIGKFLTILLLVHSSMSVFNRIHTNILKK